MAKKNKTKSSKAVSKDDCGSDDSSSITGRIAKTTKVSTPMKVCRLCETKDGPFLNVFDGDKLIGKKIDELLPFTVIEEDNLPHIICFRCSAKIEEMYEFVQKCTKTQENLNKAMGIHTLMTKNKTKLYWDAKLNKFNMSNEDICNGLVKKVLTAKIDEKNEEETESKVEKRVSLKRDAKNNIKHKLDSEDETVPLKQPKVDQTVESCSIRKEETPKTLKNNRLKINSENDQPQEGLVQETKDTTSFKNFLTFDYNDLSSSSSSDKKDKELEEPPKKDVTPFNIMDHISTIKVNGVGILFQCKLCNRNFLKKEVVLVHGCAKSGKSEVRKTTPPPEPPKSATSTVKYINLKTDRDLKKLTEKPDISQETATPETKPKPRIGPASKVKKTEVERSPSVGMMIHPRAPTPPVPSVQFPSIPSVNSRYKLVPGPNNTFTLIEDPNSTENQESTSKPISKQKSEDLKAMLNSRPGLVVKNDIINLVDAVNSDPEEEIKKQPNPCTSKIKKRKPGPKNPKNKTSSNLNMESKPATENTNLPYPVGLFQSHQNIDQPVVSKNTHSRPVPFTTPAMRKQSYTVVQTGNPSKLLISTRPVLQPEEELKRQEKSSKSNTSPVTEQPFKVTLEDSTPKSSGFFTYINIDPLLKPSHVVQSDDIIQESQISTSTSFEKEKSRKDTSDSSYPCNLCSEKFSREKKLLAHIQSHYKQMDEEDQIRDRPSRRRK